MVSFPFASSSSTSASSAVDPSRFVALGLTHVQYDAQDSLAKLLALVTLSPIFLLCSYATIVLYRRELTFLNALVGQLGCEGVNWGLKRLIRQPRPHSDLGKGYGMPSSHSQFLGFFCAFFLAHFYLHHPNKAVPTTLVNTMRRFEHMCAMMGIVGITALTCYSRYHLAYHSPAQILVGLTIGLFIGFCYYYLTEYLPRQPVRLPAPLGSPIETQAKNNPFKGKGKSGGVQVNTDSGSNSRRRNNANARPADEQKEQGAQQSKSHHRRRSSLSSLMPELHPAPPIRQLILDHPLAVAFRLRDSWTVWLDGGIEGEYEAWRTEWERRRRPYPYGVQEAHNDRTRSIARVLDEYVLRSSSSSSRNTSVDVIPTSADPESTARSTLSTIPPPEPVSSSEHLNLMSLALSQASKCEATSTAFCVGCVITDSATNGIVSVGYSREIPGNTHAEECALHKLILQSKSQSAGPSNSSQLEILNLNLYTTMEPCSERLSGSLPCAQRIISFNKHKYIHYGQTGKQSIMNIKTIYQGVTEPGDFIQENTGLRLLSENSIAIRIVKDNLDEKWIEREAIRLAKFGHQDQATEYSGESRNWKGRLGKFSVE
ncbi:unnamed protein product [Sympodiomycopsis kandeliae]